MAAETKVLGSIGAVYLVVFALLGLIGAILLVYSARLGVGYLIGDGRHPSDPNAAGGTHLLWPARSQTDSQAASTAEAPAIEHAAPAEAAVAESDADKLQRLRASSAARRNAEEGMILEEVWTADGSWQGAACDPATGDIYALNNLGEVARFDSCGKELDRVRLDIPIQTHPTTFPSTPPTTLRLANLTGDEQPEFLVLFDSNYRVGTFDAAGNRLWIYSTLTADSAHDLWPVPDLQDPDTGLEPVVVGYNGGVHLLNSDGTVRWISPSGTNHVCVGRTGSEGEVEIVTIAPDGQAHVLDESGYYVRTMQTGARIIGCLALLSPPEAYPAPVLIFGDSVRKQLTAMQTSGTTIQTVPYPIATDDFRMDVSVVEHLPWFAAAFPEITVPPFPGSPQTSPRVCDGVVALYDVLLGERLASVTFDAKQLAWTAPVNGRLPQLIAAGTPLRAFEVQVKRASSHPLTSTQSP